MAAPNPLREGRRIEAVAEPAVVLIFGASGDLTRRKLIPALYALARHQRLSPGFCVVGISRSPLSDDAFRENLANAANIASRPPADRAVWDEFARGVFYAPGDLNDPATYQRLSERLAGLDRERGTRGNRVFYLATAPSHFEEVAVQLGAAGMSRPSSSWARLIIEKPFGRDLDSARRLNGILHQHFGEEQIYRIDHYLGKEAVQNILIMRFANGIFEPVWNRRYVDHVEITAAEDLGMEGRGAYYEESGALRDMVQNHLMQLLALLAMEPPAAFDAASVRQERTKAVRAIRPIPADAADRFAVRGQYKAGFIGGQPVAGYREEKGVAPESSTETFVALKLYADTWRWADVPFYLRTGKRLPKRVTEIAIHFKLPPLQLFRSAGMAQPGDGVPTQANVLAMRIQPDEGISLKFVAKLPGQTIELRPVNMEFRYGTSFGLEVPEAYETLLLDCLRGDGTLYAVDEMVEASWALLDPVLQAWQSKKPANWPNYEAGTWGPPEAHELMERSGRHWRRP